MAAYTVNPAAVEHAKRLIDSRRYVLDSDWGEVQPDADAENAYLEKHGWDEYAEWHLGLTKGAADHTKARYAFVFGDFQRVHRSGLIASEYRAAEWRHKDVELMAHELLQLLDEKTGLIPSWEAGGSRSRSKPRAKPAGRTKSAAGTKEAARTESAARKRS